MTVVDINVCSLSLLYSTLSLYPVCMRVNINKSVQFLSQRGVGYYFARSL